MKAKKPASTLRFPPAWNWLVDEVVPRYVKKTYSPKPAWRDRPFDTLDVQFFFKGIAELSDRFTDERSEKALADYFQHPRFRSGYLLYFLPLQAAKFVALMETHAAAIQAAIEDARAAGVLRVLDLGAGPGTASFALLVHIQGLPPAQRKDLPPIEFHWWDIQGAVLEEGRELMDGFVAQFPLLRGKVKVELHRESWMEAAKKAPQASLALLGNVMNESRFPSARGRGKNSDTDDFPTRDERVEAVLDLFERLSPRGGGALLVEPADRRSSQGLSRLRDGILGDERFTMAASSASPVWGPCLHAGRCPLAQGRDWCHFSVPAEIPGKWFKAFSRKLGSERNWLKFSYLWWAARETPVPALDSTVRRVVSDPLREGGRNAVLLCEPEEPRKFLLPGALLLRRGELFDLSGSHASEDARPRRRDERTPAKPKSSFFVKRR